MKQIKYQIIKNKLFNYKHLLDKEIHLRRIKMKMKLKNKDLNKHYNKLQNIKLKLKRNKFKKLQIQIKNYNQYNKNYANQNILELDLIKNIIMN